MTQPIRKKISETHPEITQEKFYTLLIDGNNLMKRCQVDTKVNSDGLHIGTIFQFLLQIKLMIRKKNWQFIYVMWDGDNSGVERFRLYPAYKQNRDKKFILSEYDEQINDFCKRTMAYYTSKKNKNEIDKSSKEKDEEDFKRERLSIMLYLEEIGIRQAIYKDVEGDDLIAYYVKNKKNGEKIVILSEDRDLTQLINEEVCVYIPSIKKAISVENHIKEIGYTHENVLVGKILCGDSSDNIKGIKRLGRESLIKYFPEFINTKMSISEIQNKAKLLNEERVKAKKKPLEVLTNIADCVTDGIQGKDLFEINEKIINLKNPMITEEAIKGLNDIMYSPIDFTNRNFENLYTLISKDKIAELMDNHFTSFFSDFQCYINEEKKYTNKMLK